MLFGVTKQAYYKYDANVLMSKIAQETFALEYIHSIRKKDPGIGGLKLWFMYQKAFGESQPMGRDRFENIIDKYGLKVRLRVRKPKTTDSSHGLPVYSNLIKDFIPTTPNQLWVSDITYITIWENEFKYNFNYLSLILDAYTEEIVGWSIGSTLETCYPMEALQMALNRIKDKDKVALIHHSDRGCQYASKEYTRLLKSHNIQISMTENGDPKENAQAERINNTMKNELLKDMRFNSTTEARTAIQKAVSFYNNDRPHMSINMMSPAEAILCNGEIPKRWKSLRQIAIKEKRTEADFPEKTLPSLNISDELPKVNFLQGKNAMVNSFQ